MREEVRRKCDLFSENKVAIHKGFKWEYDIMSVAAGLLYTCEDRKADIEKMKACAEILKKEKSAFSAFRDIASLIVVSKMALSPDPAKYLFDTGWIYEKIKGKKVFGDAHYILAATNIIDHGRIDDADVITDRIVKIIDGYSKAHPVITSVDDVPAATLLALGDRSVEVIVNETEEIFRYLRSKFSGHSDAVQALAEVLALSDRSTAEKCDRVFAIYDALKAKGAKYGLDVELASLGALADLDIDPSVLADEIIETEKYLAGLDGLGAWTISKTNRLMFAALVVAESYSGDIPEMRNSVLVGTVALALCVEWTMVAVVATM
ncbi:MAG: DUF4003 family protein [Lachnospiraceae bacterium]|nr:DUF4003 family protein [Lachnospiraceae bacterium]